MLKSFFDRLFSRRDETEELLMQQFGFLIDVYGFHYCKTDLGNYVDENGKLLFYGPYTAYSFYSDSICLNILYLEQREDYNVTITNTYQADAKYLQNGTPVSDYYAYHLDEFADRIREAMMHNEALSAFDHKGRPVK